MRLVRNMSNDSRGKYAVVKLQKLPDDPGKRANCEYALRTLFEHGVLTYGHPGTESEFFVMLLRDKYAYDALRSYANEARDDGNIEYAKDIFELAARSGRFSIFRKRPD